MKAQKLPSKGYMSRAFASLLLCVLVLCTSLLPSFASQGQTKRNTARLYEQKVVRVAYPIQAGFTEIGPGGQYQGYIYDYLMELSQYTGWTYEFVTVQGDLNTQLGTLLEMLKNGEVDLMGALVKNDALADIYGYPDLNCGNSNNVLCALDQNTRLTAANYFTVSPLRVAVPEKGLNFRKQLAQFAELSSFEVEEVPCDTDAELLAAVREGRADALLCTDVGIPDDGNTRLRTVAQFSPRPYYIVTNKDDPELLAALNSAQSTLSDVNPNLANTLHDRYFEDGSRYLAVSNEEKAYLQELGTLRIVALGGIPPVQSLYSETGEAEGITREVLNYIAEQTGLQYELTVTNSFEEYTRILEAGEADLAAGVLADSGAAPLGNGVLTVPYVSAPLSMVLSSRINSSGVAGKQLALPRSLSYSGVPEGPVLYYDTLEECLQAVRSGQADYCYGNSYSVQYYLHGTDKDLIAIPQSEDRAQQFCFSVLGSDRMQLLTILNKAIQHMPREELLQTYLSTNAYRTEQVTFLSYIKANPGQAVGFVLVLGMILLIVFLLWNRHSYLRDARKKKLENERYEQITELSNEFLYEYDIVRDTLQMSGKSARFLGCERETKGLKTNGRAADAADSALLPYLTAAPEGVVEKQFTFPNGVLQWLRVTVKTISGSDGTLLYSVGKLTDIQQEKEKQAHLLDLAQKDSMTGLYNSACSRELIGLLLAEAGEKEAGALLIIDVDHFKSINDTYGHFVGDEVLVSFAKLLRDSFRRGDIVGRLGGDEFLVFMKDTAGSALIEEKCALLKQKALKIASSQAGLTVTLSIGVALADGANSFEELYQQADHALYEVKGSGRDNYLIAGK